MNNNFIIITGTSSGIGFGLAKYYLEKGNFVIGISRRTNNILSDYHNYEHLQIDLTNQKSVVKVFTELKGRRININLLILNAGVLGEIKTFDKIDIEAAKAIMDINLWSNKLIIDEVIKNKINCKQVAAISSGAAKNGNAGWGPYSISKAALNILIQTYASENRNTHFVAVAPGLVDTAMQDYISSLKDTEKFPSIKVLQFAKGTDIMPNPELIAPRLANLFDIAYKNIVSGSFIDIRD